MAVLGISDMTVDEEMDNPVKYYGKSHRVFFHDIPSIIARYGHDPVLLAQAALHILVDNLFTRQPMLKTLWVMKG